MKQYLFRAEEGSFGPSFQFVEEQFWLRNKHINSIELERKLGPILGPEWGEEMEATFSYWNPETGELYDIELGRQILLDLGFKELVED